MRVLLSSALENMATELVADRQVFQQTLTQEVVEIALSDTDEVNLFSGTGANEVRALIFVQSFYWNIIYAV